MTNTKTTRTNHYSGILVALAVLATVAAMLLTASRPSYAADTFTVDSTADMGDSTPDGVCDSCTLREAIQEANFTDGASVIDFEIPGTGVQTIKPSSELPFIVEPVTINGYTQAGAKPNTRAVGDNAALKIQLDGTNAPFGTNGLKMVASGTVIKGLVINRFSHSGISVVGSAVGDRIQGNFIGTDPTGTTTLGNGGVGVGIESLVDGSFVSSPSQAVVGGTRPAARNLISGNSNVGVFMSGNSEARADSNRIQGNYIGTDRSGTEDLGNDFDGILLLNASGTTIGGTTVASRNVVSGNGDNGVAMDFDTGTKILGNRIGTTAGGTGDLGNDDNGVSVLSVSPNNEIGDGTSEGSNTIAFNGKDGVQVFSDANKGEEISHNSVFSNAGLGIDLLGPGEDSATDLPTKNDADDPNTQREDPDNDTGANNLQNKSVLTSAKKSATGKTTIKGKLMSTPGRSFTIEFYSNPSDTNEGRRFIGTKSVTTDASGNETFTFSPASKVAAGQNITATATKNATGDTSEFSAPRKVVVS